MAGPVQQSALPRDIARAIDPEAMATAFGDFFAREYQGLGLRVRRCEISRVYHKPGRECTVTYRLRGRDREGREFDNWFVGRISETGEAREPRSGARPAGDTGCGFWKPVSHWPELRMQLSAFPYDARLSGLGQLLSPDFIMRQIGQHLPRFGLSEPWRCEGVECQRIKYRAGKRCVLRYEARMVDGRGGNRLVVFYGKTYDDDKSRYVFEMLQQICRSAPCRNGLLQIPEPILHLDGANTLWQRAWEGKRLVAAGREAGWENLPSSGWLPGIAAMLAALQQIELGDAPLKSLPASAALLESALEDVADILAFAPERRAVLARSIEVLERSAPGPGRDLPRSTVHGTFKIAQILCRDSELALVDFDSIARGDPLHDVAEFLASVAFLRVSDAVPAEPLARSAEIFLTCYEAQVPWACDRQRVAWYAVVLLLGKIHSALKKHRSEAGRLDAALRVLQEWLDRAEHRGPSA